MSNAIQVFEGDGTKAKVPRQPRLIIQMTETLRWSHVRIPYGSPTLVYATLVISFNGYKVSPTVLKLLRGRREMIDVELRHWTGISLMAYGLAIRQGKRRLSTGDLKTAQWEIPIMFDRAVAYEKGKVDKIYDLSTLPPNPDNLGLLDGVVDPITVSG